MKGFLNAVFQEIRLDLKESLQYRTSLLSDAAIFVGSFLAAFFLGSGSSLTSFYRADATQGIMLLLIGYLFWGNSSAALGYCTGTLQGEMERGIFEMRLHGILLAAAALLTGSSPADGGFLFFSLLLLFLPCLAGMYGMGLIAGAVSLRAKKTGSLIFLIQTALLFVTNTLTPTAPGPLFLIPFCSGIDIARRLYLYGYASAGAWAGYLLINLAWCLLGNAVFGLCMRRERRTGAWDTY